MGDGGSHSQMFARSTHVTLPAPRLKKKNFRPPAAASQGSCLQRNMLRVLSFRLFFVAALRVSSCLVWKKTPKLGKLWPVTHVRKKTPLSDSDRGRFPSYVCDLGIVQGMQECGSLFLCLACNVNAQMLEPWILEPWTTYK